MTIATRLNKIIPDLSKTFLRFPVPAAISIFMCGFMVLKVLGFYHFSSSRMGEIVLAGISAFFLAGAAHLLAESRQWSRIKAFIIASVSAILIAILMLNAAQFSANPLFILPAIGLLLMVAGFMKPGTSANALWLFNFSLGLAIILATIVGLVFGGGLSAIIAGLKFLFGLHFGNDAYQIIWIIAVAMVGPLYALSLVPHDLEEQLKLPRPDDLLNRGVSILINYVLVPVILIYVIILHAYAIKIGFMLALPKGKVGIMVLIFALGGTATWLIARPWLETGTVLLKLFTRYWFWFTIIPTVLLVLAVSERIGNYGVTPERYGLVLLGIWLAMMIVYFTLRRMEAKPKIILASLGFLLFAASFGPWGAKGFSINNQLSRLQTILQSKGYIKDGRIAASLPDKDSVPEVIRENAVSIIRFLRQQDALDRLKPIFSAYDGEIFNGLSKYAIERNIIKALNIKTARSVKFGSRWINFKASKASGFSVTEKASLYGPYVLNNLISRNGEAGNPIMSYDGEKLVVKSNGKIWEFDAKEILLQAEKAMKHTANNKTQPALKFAVENDAGKAMLIVTNVNGPHSKDKITITYIQCWLLIEPELEQGSLKQ